MPLAARIVRLLVSLAWLLVSALVPRPAAALGGFVASKSEGAPTVTSASMVLMHESGRTVLTVRADVRAPVGDLALVIPIPHAVRAAAVRTLDPGLLARLEQHTAPRMVEVWEQDPCEQSWVVGGGSYCSAEFHGRGYPDEPIEPAPSFTRGAYAITVLADPKGGEIATWLEHHGYVVPEHIGALASHGEPDRHFVIAEISADALAAGLDADGPDADGLVRSSLEPLRIVYDSERLHVPLQSSRVNPSEDMRELLVHVIAPSRVRARDYPTAVMATDVPVTEQTYGALDAFYAGVLGRVDDEIAIEFVEQLGYPHPCLSRSMVKLDDLHALGLAELPAVSRAGLHGGDAYDPQIYALLEQLVLTRVRIRSAGGRADVELGSAPSLAGGRTSRSRVAPVDRYYADNDFATRYLLRHPFRGSVDCEQPQFGVYYAEDAYRALTEPSFVSFPSAALEHEPPWWSYLVDRNMVDDLVSRSGPPPRPVSTPAEPGPGGCAHCQVAAPLSPMAMLLWLGWLGGAVARRRARGRENHGSAARIGAAKPSVSQLAGARVSPRRTITAAREGTISTDCPS